MHAEADEDGFGAADLGDNAPAEESPREMPHDHTDTDLVTSAGITAQIEDSAESRALREALERLQDQLRSREADLKGQFKAREQEVVESGRAAEELSRQLHDAHDCIDALRRDLELSEAAQNEAQDAAQLLRDQVAQLTAELAARVAEIDDLRKSNEDLTQQVGAALDAQQEQTDAIAALTEELLKYSDDVHSLQSDLRTIPLFLSSLSVLQSFFCGHVCGIFDDPLHPGAKFPPPCIVSADLTEEELQVKRSRIQALESALRTASTQMKTVQQSCSDIKTASDRRLANQKRIVGEAEKARLDLEANKLEVAETRRNLAKVTNELESTRRAREVLERERTQLRDESAASRDELSRARAQLAAQQTQLAESQQQLSEMRDRAAALETAALRSSRGRSRHSSHNQLAPPSTAALDDAAAALADAARLTSHAEPLEKPLAEQRDDQTAARRMQDDAKRALANLQFKTSSVLDRMRAIRLETQRVSAAAGAPAPKGTVNFLLLSVFVEDSIVRFFLLFRMQRIWFCFLM